MNDVNLNSPDLKLVRTSEQAPARAISSSQAEGRNASDLAGSSAAVNQTQNSQVTSEASKAEKLQARNEATREQLDDAVSQLNDFVQNVQRDM